MIKEILMRRSIRNYIDKSVEDEKIIQLLESARLAPSGSNTQPWHFIVVKSELSRENLANISHNQKWTIIEMKECIRTKVTLVSYKSFISSIIWIVILSYYSL